MPNCFCDGNGYIDCDGCDGEQIVRAFCGDDLCVGNECFHDMPTFLCPQCDGKGIIHCPAHEGFEVR